ncbi:MAG: HIT family protein [Bacteroidetes bacterium HGW-Bacteroidetes-17]|jgi:histidine triad (HIT) family protein|nr:MAG: HIT family protein [Bacteroidetes bacterium HGW-Bacteroidetes-17]
MSSIFTKIIKGEIPSYKVAEDEHFYAFLDINPLSKGHTLVVPKQEVDYIFDLDDQYLGALHIFSKKVSKAISAVIPSKRIGVVVYGLDVPHAHIHLIPLIEGNEINFNGDKLKLSTEQMAEIAKRILTAFLIKN